MTVGGKIFLPVFYFKTISNYQPFAVGKRDDPGHHYAIFSPDS